MREQRCGRRPCKEPGYEVVMSFAPWNGTICCSYKTESVSFYCIMSNQNARTTLRLVAEQLLSIANDGGEDNTMDIY